MIQTTVARERYLLEKAYKDADRRAHATDYTDRIAWDLAWDEVEACGDMLEEFNRANPDD